MTPLSGRFWKSTPTLLSLRKLAHQSSCRGWTKRRPLLMLSTAVTTSGMVWQTSFSVSDIPPLSCLFPGRELYGTMQLTHSRRIQDCPSFTSFGGENGEVQYAEVSRLPPINLTAGNLCWLPSSQRCRIIPLRTWLDLHILHVHLTGMPGLHQGRRCLEFSLAHAANHRAERRCCSRLGDHSSLRL